MIKVSLLSNDPVTLVPDDVLPPQFDYESQNALFKGCATLALYPNGAPHAR